MELSHDQWLALNAALDELHRAVGDDETDPRLLRVYARLAVGLGGARSDGDDVLGWAIDAFQRALSRIDRADAKEWAKTQIDFGDAWSQYSIYPFNRDAAKASAIAAYEAAAAAVTPETDVDLWTRAELKVTLAIWLASGWWTDDDVLPELVTRLERVIQALGEQRPYDHGLTREALKQIREMLTGISIAKMLFGDADVARCREAFDRELAWVGKYKDSIPALTDWADLMQAKAGYLTDAAERRRDLWLLTESDKVIADALMMIEGATEHVRAALWLSGHYLRQNQQRNKDLRSRIR